MVPKITEKTFRQMIAEISDQHHAMTGTVLAVMATQAVALAEACMQISLDNQVDKLNWHDVTSHIEQMAHIKATLLEWCNQHTDQMAALMTHSSHHIELNSRQMLCDHLAEIGSLSVQGATILQKFRPYVFEPISHDLETALNLLAAMTKTTLFLLKSNLRHWPAPALREYKIVQARLEAELDRLMPITHDGESGP